MSAVRAVCARGAVQRFSYPHIEGLTVMNRLRDDTLVQLGRNTHVEFAGVWLLRSFAA